MVSPLPEITDCCGSVEGDSRVPKKSSAASIWRSNARRRNGANGFAPAQSPTALWKNWLQFLRDCHRCSRLSNTRRLASHSCVGLSKPESEPRFSPTTRVHSDYSVIDGCDTCTAAERRHQRSPNLCGLVNTEAGHGAETYRRAF